MPEEKEEMIASRTPPPAWHNPKFWALVVGGIFVLVLCKGLGFAGGWWFW